jgi:DNA sulfur modification protein DndC
LTSKTESAIDLIVKTSEKYALPWEVGFSGGKDSTVTLSLIIEALEGGAKIPELYVIYTDTLLEHPVLRREALGALDSLTVLGDERIVPVRLVPGDGEDFISMVVEKGYPMPSYRFRWCMKRLKLGPTGKFLRRLGSHVEASGVRLAESHERARNIGNYAGKMKVFESSGSQRVMIMPISDWSTEDVVGYLRTHRRWDGRSFDYLLDLYGLEDSCAASPPACPADPAASSSSITVRFGCWVCTVVRREKMPTSQLLRWAKEELLSISRNPNYREFDGDGRPHRLNAEGRMAAAAVFLRVLREEPEAFGYNIDELEGKLRKVVDGSYPNLATSSTGRSNEDFMYLSVS